MLCGAGRCGRWGSGWLPACRDVVLPALSRAMGHRAEPPRPSASGEIGDIWGLHPNCCCTAAPAHGHCSRGIWVLSLAHTPYPKQPTSLAYHGLAQPNPRWPDPLLPLHLPQLHWAAHRAGFVGGYSPPAPQKKGERLPNSTAPGS